jgi:hypothetical protein
MIKLGTWQNAKAALLLRRLPTGNDRARLDSRLAVRSFAARRRFCPLRSADRVRHPLDRCPNEISTQFRNRPPAPKSP